MESDKGPNAELIIMVGSKRLYKINSVNAIDKLFEPLFIIIMTS